MDLQRALQLSLGMDSGGPESTQAVGAGVDSEDEELQRAVMLSIGRPGEASAEAGTGTAAAVARMPKEARELIRTVVTNLQRAGAPGHEEVDVRKYRQLNDSAIKKKVQHSSAPDKAYAAVVACLESIGFQPPKAEGADCRWTMPAEVVPSSALLDELLQAASPEAQQGSIPGDANSAHAASATPRPTIPAPRALADFDCLELGQLRGLPQSLQLLVYPRHCAQLVSPSDCVAWASQAGSGRAHWGSYGRRGEDDRVMMTLYCGAGQAGTGCAAHWYSPGGDERTMPSLACEARAWRWCSTHTSQAFVLRAMPQQSIPLCGLKITARPYETEGHLLLMLMPLQAQAADVLQQAGRVMSSLPADSREPTAQTQGGKPAPPPPGGKNIRGPFG